jgi:peptidoglycan/LPS O-acetylase OafA/YrhL
MPRAPENPAVIPSLDGIRAIAVGIVFLAHTGLEHLVPGGLGVTIFFVLSGFLITTLMRLEYAADGGISFRGFYLRRVLRLMPPLVVVVVLAALLSQLGWVDGAFSAGGLASVLLYLGNYFVIAHDFDGLPHGLGVMWSLAVEEHYYLFYPPIALVLLRIARVRISAAVLAGMCAAVLGWRVFLSLNGFTEHYISMATDTRIDAILAGCLMALLCNPQLDARPAPNRLRDLAIIGACLAVLAVTLLYRNEFFRLTLRYTLQAAAIAPLLYLAVANAHALPFRWLNAAPLVYIGKVSYTIYLCHHLLLLLIQKQWPDLPWIGVATLGIAMTLAIAEPMRRFVEDPCARLRKRLHGPSKPRVRGFDQQASGAATS